MRLYIKASSVLFQPCTILCISISMIFKTKSSYIKLANAVSLIPIGTIMFKFKSIECSPKHSTTYLSLTHKFNKYNARRLSNFHNSKFCTNNEIFVSLPSDTRAGHPILFLPDQTTLCFCLKTTLNIKISGMAVWANSLSPADYLSSFHLLSLIQKKLLK